MMKYVYLLIVLLLIVSCGDDEGTGPTTPVEPMEDLPRLRVSNMQTLETTPSLTIRVSLNEATTDPIEVRYELVGETAEPGVDFVGANSSVTIEPNTNSANIILELLDDDIKEVDETIMLRILSAEGAEVVTDEVRIRVLDNDRSVLTDEGYITSDEQFGYGMAWQDEFNGSEIDEASFNFEIGDGCPNLCGWGNNELQLYTDEPSNVFLENGSLVIRATRETSRDFRSARITTKDKRSFKYGRIDVRAKITRGQGMWPAIWMLGQNIDDVGWPASGEIDIMENVGHLAATSHGTAHWGPRGRGYSTFDGSSLTIDEDFAERFHVFSLVWEQDLIEWYIDETKFFTLTPANTNGETWRFNEEFFFIFNVAVGGNWPGNPDSTTEFPQEMDIDYIRVFQLD